MSDSFRYALDAAVDHFIPESEFARKKPAAGQKGFDFGDDEPPAAPVASGSGGFDEHKINREHEAHDGKRPGEFAPKETPEAKPEESEAEGPLWYGMKHRPPAPGAIPKGDFEHKAHPDFRHGQISYGRPLTEDEQRSYELSPIHEDAHIPALAKRVGEEMGEHAPEYAKPENDDILNDRLGHEDIRKMGHFDRDKLKAAIRSQFGTPEESKPTPELNEMVRAVAGYQLHGMRNEPSDPREWREHSKHMTKSAIDGWLQKKFGIDSATARGVSNAAGEMNPFVSDGSGTVGGQTVRWTHNSPEPSMDELGEMPWMKNKAPAAENPVTAQFPSLADDLPKEEATPVERSLSDLRSAHKSALAAIDAKLDETTKRLGSEKARLQRSSGSGKAAKIEALESQWQQAKEAASDEKTKLSGEFMKSMDAHPDWQAEKAKTGATAKAHQAERAKADEELSKAHDSESWQNVQSAGGYDAVKKSIESDIRSLSSRLARTGDANKWKLDSNLANKKRELERLETLNQKHGTTAATQSQPQDGDPHGGMLEHLKSSGVSGSDIEAVKKSVAGKNGVAIVNNGKVSFVDAFNPMTGNRNPQEMIDGDLKSKRGQKFAITNGTVKDEADHSRFVDRVLKHGEWDSGNLTRRQSEALESLVKDGKLTKRRGGPDESTANGTPIIYEPSASNSVAEQFPSLKDDTKPVADKAEPTATPWHADRPEVFEAMRNLNDKVSREWENARDLAPRGGTIGVGGADFDHTLKASVGEEYLRTIRKGGTPAEALAAAEKAGRDSVKAWNEKTSKGRASVGRNSELKRWEGAGDSHALGFHQAFNGLDKKPEPSESQQKRPASTKPKSFADINETRTAPIVEAMKSGDKATATKLFDGLMKSTKSKDYEATMMAQRLRKDAGMEKPSAAKPAKSPELDEIAKNSESSEDFIGKIKEGTPESGVGGLMQKVYDWAESTPENARKFKHVGWFGIAGEYWRQAKDGHEFSRADQGCRSNLIAAIHSCLNHDGKHKADESVDTQIPEDPAQLDPHVAQVLQALAGQDLDVKEALGEYLASCAG